MTPLRQRMVEDMQVRNSSPHTLRAYREIVARFARHFGRSPTVLGPDRIRAYQVHLTQERTLAPSYLGIAASVADRASSARRFNRVVPRRRPGTISDAVLESVSSPNDIGPSCDLRIGCYTAIVEAWRRRHHQRSVDVLAPGLRDSAWRVAGRLLLHFVFSP